MSTRCSELPPDVLEDVRALDAALTRWRLAKGDSPLPPELQAWRDAVAARLEELEYAGREPGELYGATRFWWYPGRLQEIGYIFETSARLNLPSRRRPTLSEYDNRRTEHVDRYSYGIYAGKYS